MQNTHWPDGHQGSIPGVRGEDGDGQIELVDPGPRVQRSDADLVDVDVMTGILPGVPGVRVGAGTSTSPVRVEQLELRLRGLHAHRGRLWSDRDRATMQAVRELSLAVDDMRDMPLVVPEWMRGETIDGPCGEIDLGKGARARGARSLLAWVWTAFARGKFGAWASWDEWASVLGVSRSTVQRYAKWLEDRGLVRRISTWQPCRVGSEIVKGSADDRVLLRIGAELEPLSLLPFASPRVKVPRRRGISRAAARRVRAVVRESVRGRGRASTREAIVRRRSYAGLEATAAAVPSTREASSSTTSSSDARGDGAQPRGRSATPLALARAADGMVKKTNHTALPGAVAPGQGLGGSQSDRGAAPHHPVHRTSSSSTSSPPVSEAQPDAGASLPLDPATLERLRWRPPVEPRAQRRDAAPAPGRRLGGGPSRTLAAAQLELARTLDALGDSAAAEAVRRALSPTVPALRSSEGDDDR